MMRFIGRIKALKTSEVIVCLVLSGLLAVIANAVHEMKKMTAAVTRMAEGADRHMNGDGGILDGLQQTVQTVNGVAVELKTAASKAAEVSDQEKRYLAEDHRLVAQTVGSINGLISSATGVTNNLQGVTHDLQDAVQALTEDLKALAPTIDMSKDLLGEIRRAVADIDKNLLNDPDVVASLKQLAGVAENLNGITLDLHKMTTDAQDKLHHYFYDPPTKKAKAMLLLNLGYRIALILQALGGL